MIPVLLLVGLLAGRWYVIPLAAIAWPLLLGLDGILSGFDDYAAAALFAGANTAVGVAVHRLVLESIRRVAYAVSACRRRHARTG